MTPTEAASMAPDESLSRILAQAAEKRGFKVAWHSGKTVVQPSTSAVSPCRDA
jgi:hypothetical protein